MGEVEKLQSAYIAWEKQLFSIIEFQCGYIE